MFAAFEDTCRILFATKVSCNRHSMTTRFLLTAISTGLFHKEETMDQLHDTIASDAERLYQQGMDVAELQKCHFHQKIMEHVLKNIDQRGRWATAGWGRPAAIHGLYSRERRLGLSPQRRPGLVCRQLPVNCDQSPFPTPRLAGVLPLLRFQLHLEMSPL